MTQIINGLIYGLAKVISAVLYILPSSPFTFVNNIDNKYFKAINYLFPVSQMVAHLSLFVTAALTYYCIRIVLRWVKASAS